MHRQGSYSEAAIPRRSGGWVEVLEARQLFTAPLCGITPQTPSAPTPAPVVQQPAGGSKHRARHGRPAAATPTTPFLNTFVGAYMGPFGSLTNGDGGAFTLVLSSGSDGKYAGSFTYSGGGKSLSMPALITVGPDGQFTTGYISAKLVVKVKGTIDVRTGRISGDFQTWDRNGTYRAAFSLDKVHA